MNSEKQPVKTISKNNLLLLEKTDRVAETHNAGAVKNKWWIVECLKCNSIFDVAGCEFHHSKCKKCEAIK
ncbi:hypothetical protein P7245_22485 [Vibrio parahaemolyticus]|nr:hypothetical protein [Vibrio parahaemolyticus]